MVRDLTIVVITFSETANAIVSFLSSESSKSSFGSENTATSQLIANGFGFLGVSALAASFSADWLPTF